MERVGKSAPAGLFRTLANTRLWRTTKQTPGYAGEVTKLYREIFTPTRPKKAIGEFAGRADTIASIIQSIEEEQAHVLLLGRRSLGKSSILNVVAEAAREAGFLIARIACTTDLTFDEFMHTVFEDLSVHAAEAAAGDALTREVGVDRLSDLVDASPQSVQSALQAFSRISSQRVLVLVDDFHLVRDTVMRRRLGDLLGTLTASGASTSMVIAARDDGTGHFEFDDGEEASGTVAVVLDGMRPDDISEILLRGGRRLGVRFGEEVLQSIVLLCQGSPAIAQWLGLLTARRVLRRYDGTVTMQDLVAAAKEAAERADPYTCSLLDKARTARGNVAELDNVLYLAARTPHGPEGAFSPALINREAAFLGAPPYSEPKLHRLLTRHSIGAGAIVEKLAAGDGQQYRFTEPLMRSIVLLRNAPREQPSDGEVLNAYLQHQSQSQPKTAAALADDFWVWLRFVLPTEDAARLLRWADQDQLGQEELRNRFRQAQDEHEIATLLQEIHSLLSGLTDVGDSERDQIKEGAA